MWVLWDSVDYALRTCGGTTAAHSPTVPAAASNPLVSFNYSTTTTNSVVETAGGLNGSSLLKKQRSRPPRLRARCGGAYLFCGEEDRHGPDDEPYFSSSSKLTNHQQDQQGGEGNKQDLQVPHPHDFMADFSGTTPMQLQPTTNPPRHQEQDKKKENINDDHEERIFALPRRKRVEPPHHARRPTFLPPPPTPCVSRDCRTDSPIPITHNNRVLRKRDMAQGRPDDQVGHEVVDQGGIITTNFEFLSPPAGIIENEWNKRLKLPVEIPPHVTDMLMATTGTKLGTTLSSSTSTSTWSTSNADLRKNPITGLGPAPAERASSSSMSLQGSSAPSFSSSVFSTSSVSSSASLLHHASSGGGGSTSTNWLLGLYRNFWLRLRHGAFITQLASCRQYVNNIHLHLGTADVLELDYNAGRVIEFPLAALQNVYGVIRCHPTEEVEIVQKTVKGWCLEDDPKDSYGKLSMETNNRKEKKKKKNTGLSCRARICQAQIGICFPDHCGRPACRVGLQTCRP